MLHSFGVASGDGWLPNGGLVLDSAGILYGTTEYGGMTVGPCPSSGCGIVFKLDLTTDKETVLHSFTGTGGDGANPFAGVILDSVGNMYGTTEYGGSNGSGTALKLNPTGNEMWVYSFGSTIGDGANPLAGVVLDSAGNLYGTTQQGGASGFGTVFKVSSTGNETALYSFTGTNGEYPASALIIDRVGNLYGFTPRSQQKSGGEFFKLDTSGQGTTLYSFPPTNGDGADSYAGLVRDSSGNFYGTTPYGGLNDFGTVFKLGTTGKETVLHSFGGMGGDGAIPQAGLILDGVGNLYGTTTLGGNSSSGTVFEVDPTGKETVLYNFGSTGGDGMFPSDGLVSDSMGNLYGTTYAGGNTGGTCVSGYGCGTVFKLDLTAGTETVLYSFTGMSGDGGNPVAGVILDGAGHLYGTTLFGGTASDSCDASSCGTVFKLDLTTGKETVLHDFTGTNGDGANPSGGVVLDGTGNVYGTTQYGGSTNCLSYGCGTIFKLDPSGNEIWVYDFYTSAGVDGAYPHSGLVRDSAGNFYGTTEDGGSNGWGTIFKVDPSGNETVFYSFGGTSGDGANPYGGLLLDNAGNLYGTTSYAGSALAGTVFKLSGPAAVTFSPTSLSYGNQVINTTSTMTT